ncbi:MAG: hypothetical protein FWD44_04335 [Oscillospiraceae bacterium]|nr:hypothetical protein [Oscillospiraceae bacterium]
MKKIDIDTILSETLKSDELPPLSLIQKTKAAASVEMQSTQKYGTRRLSRVLFVAAVICLALGTTITAIATNFFGLRDMLLPSSVPLNIYLVDNDGNRIHNPGLPWADFVEANPDAQIVEHKLDAVALQGLPGSPEFDAIQMWWKMHMMPYDGRKLSPEKIAEAHGLIYQGHSDVINYYEVDPSDFEPFFEIIAYEPFFDESISAFPGYVYPLGTFSFDGYYGNSSFQFRHTRKGTLDLAFWQVSDITAFDDWSYTNKNGTTALLMQDARYSVIIVGTDRAFIIITIHGGNEPFLYEYCLRAYNEGRNPEGSIFETVTIGISKSELEALVDMIDFTKLK